MKAVGIIVEYNPLHNGHLLHLETARKLTKANVIIAIMSGNYLQRGDIALVDKWTRSQMALNVGVDLVVELPTIYASQPAHIFAHNALFLLNSIKCDRIVFGSETGKIHNFFSTSKQILKNKTDFDINVKKYIASGISYPKAVDLAAKRVTNEANKLDLSLPNNNLGFHYINEIKKNNFKITPLTFKRIPSGYYEKANLKIASATTIRNKLEADNFEDVYPYLPIPTRKLMHIYNVKYGTFHNWELYWKFLRFRIMSMSPSQLRRIYEMKEGIEYRLISSAKKANSFKEFLQLVQTKRYTNARIKRLCLYVLLNLENDFLASHPSPPYIRLLAISEKGRHYIKINKNAFTLPIFNNKLLKDFPEQLRFNSIYYQVLNKKRYDLCIKRELERPNLQSIDSYI